MVSVVSGESRGENEEWRVMTGEWCNWCMVRCKIGAIDTGGAVI